MFSEGVERGQWHEMGEDQCFTHIKTSQLIFNSPELTPVLMEYLS